MFCVFFLCSLVCGDCHVDLDGNHGLKTYTVHIEESCTIKIEYSVFEAFLLVNDAPPGTKVEQYTSYDSSEPLTLNITFDLDEFHSPIIIAEPFAYHLIKIVNSGLVSISYGSLPGMCTQGVLFSNEVYKSFMFSRDGESYLKIGLNDDKCIVLTQPSLQIFSLSMNTEMQSDKLFIYQGMEPIKAYSGSLIKYISLNTEIEPSIIRYISDSQFGSEMFTLVMNCGNPAPLHPFTYFHNRSYNNISPLPPSTECRLLDVIPVSTMLLIVASMIVIGSVILLVAYLAVRIACPRFILSEKSLISKKDEPEPWQSPVVSVQDRAEPTGYFALDPYLRSTRGGE